MPAGDRPFLVLSAITAQSSQCMLTKAARVPGARCLFLRHELQRDARHHADAERLLPRLVAGARSASAQPSEEIDATAGNGHILELHGAVWLRALLQTGESGSGRFESDGCETPVRRHGSSRATTWTVPLRLSRVAS